MNDEKKPALTTTTPFYWRGWAIGLFVVGAVTLIAGETGTARPVGLLLLTLAGGTGAVALGRRAIRFLRRAMKTPRPDKPYGSHAA